VGQRRGGGDNKDVATGGRDADGRHGRLRWTQQWLGGLLAVMGGLGLLAVLALAMAVVATDGWAGLSAPKLSAGATALAFVAACFSAFAGLRSADAGLRSADAARDSATAARDSATAGRDSATAGRDSATAAQDAYGQQLYELARSLHADLTTGEVGQARDRLGTVARLHREWSDDSTPISTFTRHVELHLPPQDGSVEQRMAEVRRDWFTLLWCFQRIRAADELLEHAPVTRTGSEHPHRFLRRLIASQVRFLNKESVHSRAAIRDVVGDPDDNDSKVAFIWLVETLAEDDQLPGQLRDDWAAGRVAWDTQWQACLAEPARWIMNCGSWAEPHVRRPSPPS